MGLSRFLHLVALRGNAAEYPENTLPALQSALALGARFLAIDVQLSAEGVPQLADVVALIRGRPEVTLFVGLGTANLTRFGHDPVITAVADALAPVKWRSVLVSSELPVAFRARELTGQPIAWEVPACDEHTRLKLEAIQPEFLFCERTLVPAEGALPRGPWRWVVHDVTTLDEALDLAERGADFVATRAVRAMSEAMRAHARARAPHDGPQPLRSARA